MVKAKKSLGQNFLRDESVVVRMVEFADIAQNEAVIEIGPGTGVLTRALMRVAAHVYAVEMDASLIPQLTAGLNARRLTVIYGDILQMDLAQLCRERGIAQYSVVANIPYYITGKIVRLLLGIETPPRTIVLMVQKEVAERICAPAGEMSLLAVSVQYLADTKYCFTVGREKFDPAPKIDSAVVQITPHKELPSIAERAQFFRIVRAGFSARRKTLVNNLATGLNLDKAHISDILRKIDITLTARAQELSIVEWRKLVKELN